VKKLIFVFDVDSTIIKIESLNNIISKNIKNEDEIKRLSEISAKALNGEYDYHKAFLERFYLTKLTKENFINENKIIEKNLIHGIKRIINFIKKQKHEIFLVSGGFRINILHVAKLLKIIPSKIFSNDFSINKSDNTLSLIESSLIYGNGKSIICKKIKDMFENPTLIMIGDGVTDLEVYKEKIADEFIGVGYVVSREKVLKESNYFAKNINELRDIIKQIILKY
jgi:HAD superfamily phosphoserine phosphatase-like hydrolase